MVDQLIQDGLVHLYYGPGKGKTTAAMGLAVRALGHDLSVSVHQFMKGAEEMREQYGEVQQFRDMPQIEVRQFSASHARNKDDLSPEERETLENALDAAVNVVSGGAWDIVILDEILTLYDLDLAEDDRFVDIIHAKDESVEVLLTGREAPPTVVNESDYVTYLADVKHPFRHGVKPRVGIEY